MKKMKFAAIVNFCSNDQRFLQPFITEMQKAVSFILFVVADHFFDGSQEDIEYLYRLFSAHPNVYFLLYPLDKSLLPKVCVKEERHVWASLSRTIGYTFLPKNITHTFFLDVDEIPEGKSLQYHLQQKDFCSYDCAQLACYWYFRSPAYQANTWEATPVLVKNSHLYKKLLRDKDERQALFVKNRGKKHPFLVGKDKKPLFHHYSWVRCEEEMQKKVTTWGHAYDRDWKALVKKEFASEFSGTDFVHGYQFTKVDPHIALTKPSTQFLEKQTPNLLNGARLSKKEAYASLYFPYFLYPRSLKAKIFLAKNHFTGTS